MLPITTRSQGEAWRWWQEFAIKANHTFNPEQIEWFKYGSALNLMKAKMAA